MDSAFRWFALLCIALFIGCSADKVGSKEQAIIECNGDSVGQVCDTDNNLCTQERCVLQAGSVNCVFQQNATNGTVCESDNLPCTSDTCQEGVCESVPLPMGTLCDDGLFCTANDSCDENGLCQSLPLDCDDGNDCTDNMCDEVNNECVAAPLPGNACDDGNACTENSTCSAGGVCQNGSPVSCADGNDCTSENCNPATGCTFDILDGSACDDTFFCTIGELCEITGDCQGEANCLDGDQCTADSCDDIGDSCTNTITPGAPCTDLSQCTENDACAANGTCQGTPVLNGTVCGTAGGCIAAGTCLNGDCQGGVPEPDLTPCDDEDLCTEFDFCTGGACLGYPVNCSDGDPCTADGCDQTTGCVNLPIEGCVSPDAGTDGGVPDGTPNPDGGTPDGGETDGGSSDAGRGGILGGGGCNQSGSTPTFFALLVLLALFTIVRRRRGTVALLVLIGAPLSANSQELDSEIFQAGSSSTAFLSQPSNAVLPHLSWNLALALNVSADPLVLRDADTGEPLADGVLVSRRDGAYLSAAIGLGDRWEVGFAMPFVVAQDGAEGTMNLSSASLGDLRIDGKGRVFSMGSLDLSASISVTVPSGDGDALYGESSATVTPRLILGASGSRYAIALNIGARIREENRVSDLVVDDELVGGIGASFAAVPERLWIVAEGYGRRVLSEGRAESTPAETLAGVRLAVVKNIQLQAAAGIGIGRGYGTPAWRGILGFAYVPATKKKEALPPPPEKEAVVKVEPPPPVQDTDGDGIFDDKDGCIDEPEDFDEFEDEDGCPEPDNDNDGILDADDRCPLQAEIVNGIQDEDGCPDEGIIVLVEDRITLEEKVLFDQNRARVKHQGRKALRAIIELYRQHPEWGTMNVEGHADYTGPADYNLELSQRRAARVRDAMIKMGMDPEKISSEGFGETRPLVKGQNEEAQTRNRRVEFVILNLKKEVQERILVDPETGALTPTKTGTGSDDSK